MKVIKFDIPCITQNKVVRAKNKASALPLPFFVHPCICAPMHCMRWLEKEATLFQVG